MTTLPLRIAIWHDLPSGGGKRALYDQVAGLVARGHHVEAWAPPTRHPGYLPLDPLIPEHIVPFEWHWQERRTDKWQLTLQTERQIRAMDEHCAQCAREIAAGGFDLLFANSCQYFRTTAIGRFATIPSVFYLQEPFRWLYEALPDNPWAAPERPARSGIGAAKRAFADWRRIRNARVQVREEVANARAFDRILCNSYFSRESILRAYGIEAQVCYLGIGAGLSRPFPYPRAGHVVGLGSFAKEKGLGTAIRAIAAMDAPRPPLVWIGNHVVPEYMAEMRQLATGLGVELDARVLVPDDELLDLVGTATAMIYTPRLEPFGFAPLEANACMTPVVAIAEGGVRETVRDGVNGLLADPSPTALAAALTRLFRDPALAERLGRQGYEAVRTQWSTEAATDRLLAAFEDVLAAG